MKNILKYTLAAATALAFAACTNETVYDTIVDSPNVLAYVATTTASPISGTVSHTPIGSVGNLDVDVTIKCSSTRHSATTVTLNYDASLAEAYNTEKGTEYPLLPADLIVATPVTIPDNEDSALSHISLQGDLSVLTEPAYLAAFHITSQGVDASEKYNKVYCLVKTGATMIRPITTTAEFFGRDLDRTGWTSDNASPANLFDGSTTTYCQLTGQTNTSVIDMGATQNLVGFKLRHYASTTASQIPTSILVEYSTDGVNYTSAGTATNGTNSFSSDYTRHVAFYGVISARYLKLTITFGSSTSTYLRLYEFNAYGPESALPLVYTVTGTDNAVALGNLIHTPVSSTGLGTTSFTVRCTDAIQAGRTVTVAADNSLIAAYNAANGTSYAALPAANLTLKNAPSAIGSMKYVSSKDVEVSISGDLKALTERSYLIPLRLTSQGAESDDKRSVVYVTFTTEVSLIRPAADINDMVGTLATRTGWTASGNGTGAENLFDGSATTYYQCTGQYNNVLTIDMASSRKVAGIGLRHYAATTASYIPGITIEYSVDGTNYSQAGTSTTSNSFSLTSDYTRYVAFYSPIQARYMRLTLNYGTSSATYLRVYGFNVYETDSDMPLVYTVMGTNNTVSLGKLTLAKTGASGLGTATFAVRTTNAAQTAVTVAADNSLVEAYNTANGTSYAALPSGNLTLTNNPCTINAMQFKSDKEIEISITGNLSSLTERSYLIPLKLTAQGATTSPTLGVVYATFTTEVSLLRPISAIGDMVGTLATRTGWTAEGAGTNPANLFDGSTTTYYQCTGQYNNVITIDMASSRKVSGIGLRHYATTTVGYIPAITIEYSVDGTNYSQAGTTTTEAGVNSFTQNSDYTRYVAFYDPIQARYMRLTLNYATSSSTYLRVYGFSAYEPEMDTPTVYAVTGTNNVVTAGAIQHTPISSVCTASTSFTIRTSTATAAGYTVNVAADNSLIAAYNTAKGTSYEAIPAANLALASAPATIAADAYKSTVDVRVSLTGTLTALTAKNGYIVPLKLTAQGATTSPTQGVVYVIFTTDYTIIRPITALTEMTGTIADRTGWVATGAGTNPANMLDGSTTTYYQCAGQSNNVITFDLASTRKLTGFGLRHYNSTSANYVPTMIVEYSTDGVTYSAGGTTSSSNSFTQTSNYTRYVAFYGTISARYLRLTLSYGTSSATYLRVYEFDVYESAN